MPGSKWNVEFLDVAYRQYLELPDAIRFRLGQKLAVLEASPHPPGSKKLEGHENMYRVRSGDYRAVYVADPAARRITVVRVRHRKDAYRGL